QVGKVLVQLFQLRLGGKTDVRLCRMSCRIVLMIRLGSVEGVKGLQGSGDGLLEHATVVELVDICLGDPFFVFAAEKNHGAVLAANNVALAVQLGRVVGDGKEQ